MPAEPAHDTTARPGAGRLDWAVQGADWPNADASRFIDAGGLRWHLQQFGPAPAAAPVVLLLHGTGAATHSWRVLAPLLGRQFAVLAPDLPGHGFTTMPPASQLSLPGMARAVAALVRAAGVEPTLVVGHSAGAAIALRMALEGWCVPRAVVALNGACLPLGGLAGRLFSPAARLLAGSGVAAHLFARLATDPAVAGRLLRGTGSTIDPVGERCYAQLIANPGHVAGALAMMANWDLRALERDLPAIEADLLLIVGERDRTVPPAQAQAVRRRVPHATIETLPGLGHLAHEEQPDRVAELIGALARRHRLIDGP
ncbi:MAG: alpha/beta fold hydrolase [Burkholderiales bacterium]|nr:alpha/beta fold hydrolase [Burkholderiales bacterium]